MNLNLSASDAVSITREDVDGNRYVGSIYPYSAIFSSDRGSLTILDTASEDLRVVISRRNADGTRQPDITLRVDGETC